MKQALQGHAAIMEHHLGEWRPRLRSLGKRLIYVLMLLSLVGAAFAEDAPKPLVEINPQLDLTKIKATKSALVVKQDGAENVLSMTVEPNAAFPGIHLDGKWDLSAAKGVQAVLTNPGDQTIGVSLRVENDVPGQKNAYSIQTAVMGPGETRTVQTVFGQSYGNSSFALDPTKIVGLTIYIGGQPAAVPRTVLIRSLSTFTSIVLQQPADVGKPPGEGLVVWLDPSKDTSVSLDVNRNLSQITDRSGCSHDAVAAPNPLPQLTALDGKHRPMLHFTGGEALTISGAIRSTPGGMTVFVVYARVTGKQQPGPHPSLFSSHPDDSKPLDAAPNVFIPGPDDKAPWRFMSTVAVDNVPIGPITIGQDFSGDIGEVLVYDHIFTSEGERRKVLEYLSSKWGVGIPEPGWVRDGPLDPIPQRTHDNLPLSDQANAGQWNLDSKFTDEFDEKAIDPARYHLDHTEANDWWGRSPGLFQTQNVTLKDGALNIKLDKGTPEELQGHGGYKYTSGYISTIQRTGYGYYEITARPGKAEFDNAFWFTDTGDPNNGLEIDVFEMGPHTKDYHNKDIMTAHVWGENGDKRHWGSLVGYTTPWDTGDDFHVYGLEWTKDNIIWYIDGSPVRKLPNTNWHLPMKMIFDCEPMLDWFGPVDDKDFPTAFVVKYVRVWRQAGYVVPPPVTPAPTK